MAGGVEEPVHIASGLIDLYPEVLLRKSEEAGPPFVAEATVLGAIFWVEPERRFEGEQNSKLVDGLMPDDRTGLVVFCHAVELDDVRLYQSDVMRFGEDPVRGQFSVNRRVKDFSLPLPVRERRIDGGRPVNAPCRGSAGSVTLNVERSAMA